METKKMTNKKMKKTFWEMMNEMIKNTKGVSYVVSVLIVTVVVVVGALGVGVIQSSMSTSVSQQISSADAGANAGAEILIAGSTTVQPLSECLGALYSDKNNIRVTVQGGGSGAGVSSAGLGIVDIGSSSSDLTSTQLTTYPELQPKKIGGSAVAFIASTKCGAVSDVTNASNLSTCYQTGACTISTASGTVTKVYDRADASGTEDTASKYLGWQDSTSKQLKAPTSGTVNGATGNQGVVDAIVACGSTTCCLGFADFGVANGVSGVTMLNVSTSTGAGNYAPTSTTVINALKGISGNYPSDLTRPLIYVTNGAPSAVVKNYITFATTPGDKTNVHDAANCFAKTGTFAVWEFS